MYGKWTRCGFITCQLIQVELFPRTPFLEYFQSRWATRDILVQDLECKTKEIAILYGKSWMIEMFIVLIV